MGARIGSLTRTSESRRDLIHHRGTEDTEVHGDSNKLLVCSVYLCVLCASVVNYQPDLHVKAGPAQSLLASPQLRDVPQMLGVRLREDVAPVWSGNEVEIRNLRRIE